MSSDAEAESGTRPRQVSPEVQPGAYVLAYGPAPQDVDIRLADIWRILVRGKWTIVVCTVLFTVVGVIIAFTMTPVYRAEVLMAPVPDDSSGGGFSSLAGQLGGLAAIAGMNLEGGNNTVEAVATLKSRAFTEAFIRDRGLIPVLFEDETIGETAASNVEDLDGPPTMWDAYERFDSLRSVSEDARTGLVTLAVDWTDPELAADWANDLIKRVNERLRERAFDEASSNLEFLRGELDKTSIVEIRDALFGLIEAEMKNAMLANVRDEFAFKIIDPAIVPEERFKPKRRLLILFGFALGTFLGVIVVLLRGAIKDYAPPPGR